MRSARRDCFCSFDNVDHRKHLEDLLPPDYRYQVTKFRIVRDPENPNPPLMETKGSDVTFQSAIYPSSQVLFGVLIELIFIF